MLLQSIIFLKPRKGNKMVVLKKKLDKRAKLQLKLENIIKYLKKPSGYLKKAKKGREDPQEEETRFLILAYSQYLSDAMKNQTKSLDKLYYIAGKLYKMRKNFEGPEELRPYLERIIEIAEIRLKSLYKVKTKFLKSERAESLNSSISP